MMRSTIDVHQKVEILGQAAALDCEGPPALTHEERKAQFIDQSRMKFSREEVCCTLVSEG